MGGLTTTGPFKQSIFSQQLHFPGYLAVNTSNTDQSPLRAADQSPPRATDQSPPRATDQSPPRATDQSPPRATDQSPPPPLTKQHLKYWPINNFQ
jgi:hypothetical protein